LFCFVTVTDFEDQLQQKNADMEQQMQLVSDLDLEIKRFQVKYRRENNVYLICQSFSLLWNGLFSWVHCIKICDFSTYL